MLLRKASASLPTLSPAAKDIVLPFLLPPIYAESWFSQQLGLPPAAAAAGSKAHAATARDKRPGATAVNCEASTLTRFWKRLSTAHFNIHYIALGTDPFYDAYQLKGAETIAAVVEEVYRAETDLFKRFPLADTTEKCNGGDGALDIYLTVLGSSDTRGATTSYPDPATTCPASSTANSLVCPTTTVNSLFDSSWAWMHVDDPSLYAVAADGRTVEGEFSSVLPGGGTIKSVWKLQALRE